MLDMFQLTTIMPRFSVLKLGTNNIYTVDHLVNSTSNYSFQLFKPMVRLVQIKDKMPWALRILKGLKPRAALEVGTANGEIK